MQMIWAIIRTDALPRVRKTLRDLGIHGYTVVEVEGRGEEQAFFSILSEELIGHRKVEILANEERVDVIVDALARAAHTGVPGDGVIATYPIGRYVKIEQVGKGSMPFERP